MGILAVLWVFLNNSWSLVDHVKPEEVEMTR